MGDAQKRQHEMHPNAENSALTHSLNMDLQRKKVITLTKQ
jgi:hypothetical protein